MSPLFNAVGTSDKGSIEPLRVQRYYFFLIYARGCDIFFSPKHLFRYTRIAFPKGDECEPLGNSGFRARGHGREGAPGSARFRGAYTLSEWLQGYPQRRRKDTFFVKNSWGLAYVKKKSYLCTRKGFNGANEDSFYYRIAGGRVQTAGRTDRRDCKSAYAR